MRRVGMVRTEVLVHVQQHDLLAALCGDFPSQGPAGDFDLSSLQLPQELPVSLPSQLVEQRGTHQEVVRRTGPDGRRMTPDADS